MVKLEIIIELHKMSAVLLNCKCEKRILFELMGGHMQLIY